MIVRRSNRNREAALRVAEAANAGLEAAVAERTEHLRLANEEIQRSAIIINNSAIVINNTITSMAEAVLVVDEHRTILLSNPAATRLFGYSPGMTIEPLAERNSTFQADGVTPLSPDQTPMGRALRGEQCDGTEVIVRRADATDAFMSSPAGDR